MTNFLQRTIQACDAMLERELANAEILMRDHGASPEQIEAVIGPGGYTRMSLERDRAAQIAEVTAWLSGTEGTRH
jgi:hypothetical protein